MDRFLPPQPVPVIAPGKRVASLYERPAPAVRYTVSLAVDVAEIREAQRLRYQVFSEEQGARLPTILSGHDIDPLDDMCEHVLVRELDSGVVVGTYRILAPARVADAGGYFSERHFDLSRLDSMRPHMAELGRSCVHPGHRSGAVITRLWQGLASYMTRHGHDYLVGCVSLSMHDAGKNAARVCREVTQQYPAPSAWRVTPHHPMALDLIDDGAAARLPPLVKGYTRLGALVCGPPAWDRDFNTAGLLMLLPMVQLNRRYARWLLR